MISENFYKLSTSVILLATFLILLMYFLKKQKRNTKRKSENNYKNAGANIKNKPRLTGQPQKPMMQPNPSDFVKGSRAVTNEYYNLMDCSIVDDYYVRIKIGSPDFFHCIINKNNIIKKIKQKLFKHKLTREEKRIWRQKRHDFNLLKQTDAFKLWRKAQFVAQGHQCAWCRCTIKPGTPNVHVDHIQPLYYGGSNEYNNFVLACRTCNMLKSNDVCGWGDNGHINGNIQNKKPSWIVTNPYAI